MSADNSFISWGVGVNSTAIIALHLLGTLQGKPEIIFADTGGELPQTYEYYDLICSILKPRGWDISKLDPVSAPSLYTKRAKGKYLYDLLWEMETVPSFQWRFCTGEYKQRPIKRYAKDKVKIMGICADEARRMVMSDGVVYPLQGYTREDCKELIREAGLPPAHKTGCYFCPMQRKAQWIDLHDRHPDLWARSVALEEHSKRWKFLSNGRTIAEQMSIWKSDGKRDRYEEYEADHN